MGDILASYIMSLIDDQKSCENIDTLDSFMSKDYYTEINCPVCDEENTIRISEIYDGHECENCRIAVFSNIEVGSNDPGENYLRLEDYDINYYDPNSGVDLEEIDDVKNLGGFGDKYFMSDNMLLHFNWPRDIHYYELVIDQNGDYHAGTGGTATVNGDDYLEMNTGRFHKILTDGSVETQGYEEAELQEEEE